MKQNQEQKKNNPNINKMLKYTAKKILWLINYSLSFSEKDTGKKIGIKVLGCLVILHCLSIFLFVIFSLLEIILFNPLFAFGLILLIGVFIFKKEIIKLLKSKRNKEGENTISQEQCSN